MKKSNLIMIIVSISIFVVLIIGATYAYFASNTTTGNGLDMTITTDENNIAFAATEGTLSMHVKAEDMLESQTGNGSVLAAETIGEDNIIITLSTNTATPIACTYNVYFKWNGNGYVTPTVADQNEITLELNLEDEDQTGSEGTNSFASETQMTNVVTTTNKTKIVNEASIVADASNSGRQEWIPTLRFYNLNKDQSELAGVTLSGKYTIEDVVCEAVTSNTGGAVEGSLSAEVLGLVNDNEYTSSQDQSKYVVRHEEVEYDGTTLDAGVRYAGNDPDNYVQFNGTEEWRIIGVFEGSTIGLEPGKKYTKIIKSAVLDYMPWNYKDLNENGEVFMDDEKERENDWVNSSLYEYLNGEYFSNLKDKELIAQYKGKYSTWYLRGTESNAGYNASASEWYLIERTTGMPGYRNGVSGEAAAIVQAPVGLMYPSDYGYSAYGEGCALNSSLGNFGRVLSEVPYIEDGCLSVLWTPDAWTLAPYTDTQYYVYMISAFIGGIGTIDDSGAGGSYDVYPTLYLEHDIMIVGGNGSKGNPYKIS